jgi:hypothetical protein
MSFVYHIATILKKFQNAHGAQKAGWMIMAISQ